MDKHVEKHIEENNKSFAAFNEKEKEAAAQIELNKLGDKDFISLKNAVDKEAKRRAIGQ